ncbi:radical SAM family heme chaperone HemW [Helicobacter sp. MIT 99-5507]|uniref:radical SAM family heme chaperone HemW n=1 Tax=Helicobacter sp. MIT 99-5507 TaxID=152489 RepID=UPI0015F13F96|nr:radical SAM family heme chaperone HemW [Helicobacter sp. MIT 99-5507]
MKIGEEILLLYIHIPFCESKCGYCAFNSFTNLIDFKKQYLDSLKIDLESSLNNINNLDSIFFGGGTPNVLNPKDYEEVFKILKPYIGDDTEITMELNPNRDIHALNDFKSLGINRFSIGVQSFREDKLRLLERNHNPKTAYEFIKHAILCNIFVSIDLIYDTKLDTKQSLESELKMANDLGVGHISCYALSIDKDSRFYKMNKNPTLQNSLCYEIKEILDNFSFYQYEVSNYAKNHKSKHNLAYWQGKEYMGVGLGAVGRIKNNRIYKQNDFKKYIENPLKCSVESLNDDNLRLESIFLGLRSEVGVDIENINTKKLEILLQEKKCIKKDNRIYATNYFISDELALWLT